jgi:drug/metabolite transporter (DMT)-like permease
MSPARYSMLLMIGFGVLWAAVESVAVHLSRGYSPYQVVWTRYAVHLGFMLAVWGWRQPLSLFSTRRPLFQFGRSALMLIMPVSFVVGATRGLDHAALMAVFGVTPLLVLAFSGVFLQEMPTFVLFVAAAGAGAGAALLLSPEHAPASMRLLLWPLVMAASFSLYIVMTRSLRTETTRANLFYTALGVFLALSPLMPAVWIWPTAHDLAVMVAIGLLGWAGLYCLDRLAAAAPVTESAPLTLVQVVITVGLGTLAGHFQPRPELWTGLALSAGAVLLTWWRAPALKVQAI